jgi:hypothetical protein
MAEAAARLRHDLGKYIRFSAAETLETDTTVLRERLRADVLATRRTDSATQSASEVFEQWQREEAAHFGNGAPAETLARLSGTMDELRRLSAEIDSLDRPGLERLDALTRDVARECRALFLETKS